MPGGGHSASAISTIATDTQHQVKTYTADNGTAHRPAGPHAHYNKVRARRFAPIAKLISYKLLLIRFKFLCIDSSESGQVVVVGDVLKVFEYM